MKSWITELLFVLPSTLAGQTVTKGSAVAMPGVEIPELHVKSVDSKSTRLGKRIRVVIDGLPEAVKRGLIKPEDFVLYLGGYPVWNSHATLVTPWAGELEFRLERADTSQATWVALLGRPTSMSRGNVRVGVGYGTGPELLPLNPDAPPRVKLEIADGPRFALAFIFLAVALGTFLGFAHKSDMIRDTSPPSPPNGKRKPYSLGRLQMAIWFFLVITAFVFLYIVTGSLASLNQTALILIGIGAGTALTAAGIDKSNQAERNGKLSILRPKAARLKAQVQQLESAIANRPTNAPAFDLTKKSPEERLSEARSEMELTVNQIRAIKASEHSPISEWWLKDVLSDPAGISFHRFQMVLWTFVLGAVFLYEVWDRLAMPEFNGTLLALMGISAGTFIGFKLPEGKP